MKARYCKGCAVRIPAREEPRGDGLCAACHRRWVAEYTSPAAKARREKEFAELVKYAKEIGLVPRSYYDEDTEN